MDGRWFERGLKSAWFTIAIAVAVRGWELGKEMPGPVLFALGCGQALSALRSYIFDGRGK